MKNLGLGAAGAALGALLGIGVQLALEVYGQLEAPWAPVVIGLLTGLGVRQMDRTTAAGVSYVRGAIAGLLALAAIVGAPHLVANLRAARGFDQVVAKLPQKPAPPIGSQGDGDGGAAADLQEPPPRAVDLPVGQPELGPQTLVKRPDQFSTWQFIFMAVGMLLAYEFARGTEVRYLDEDPGDAAGRSPHPEPAARDAAGARKTSASASAAPPHPQAPSHENTA